MGAMKTWVRIAHRGGRSDFPENTIAAINASLRLGADLVEIDIRGSRDNVPVVVHDETLHRLFGLNRKIDEMDALDLFALRHERGSPPDSHRIFSFAETLAALDAPKLLLHIKEPSDGLEETIEILMDGTTDMSGIVFGAVTLDAYSVIRSANPEWAILGFVPKPEDIPEFIRVGVDIVRLWDEWVTPELIEGIHREGAAVWVMVGRPFDGEVGETTPARIAQLEEMEIDGILINDIRLLP